MVHFFILFHLIRVYVLPLPNVSSCFEAQPLGEQSLDDGVYDHAHAHDRGHCHWYGYGYGYVHGDANFLPGLLIFDRVDGYG